MKKNLLKRTLSFALCVLMVFSLMPIIESKAITVFNPIWPTPNHKEIRALEYYSSGREHGGIDIGTPSGTDVLAVADGKVVKCANNCVHWNNSGDMCSNGCGNYVAIEHNVNGKIYTSIYEHFTRNTITVKVGEPVKKGTVIGKSGSSGNSTGPHLHLEVYEGKLWSIKSKPERSRQTFQLYVDNAPEIDGVYFTFNPENSKAFGNWILNNCQKVNGYYRFTCPYKAINANNDKISASQIPVPVVKKQGTPFEFFQGTVSANTGMAFTAATVYDSTGKAVKFKYKYHGKAKPVSITASDAFDSLVDFSTLSAGEYTLKLYATCKRSLNNSIISDLLAIINGNMLLVYDGSFTVSNSGVRSIAKVSSRSASYSRIKTDKYGNTYMVYSGQFTESSHYDSAASYPIGTYKITAKSGLNTRSKPTANSTKLSGWSYGTNVNVTATDGNWGYTSRGWICLNYAEYVSAPASSYNSNITYDTGVYTVSTAAGLNCRKGPGTSYNRITALKNGTQFSATKTDGAWGYSPEYGGWLCLQYATRVGDLIPELPVPGTPELSSSTPNEIGVNESINVSWNAVDAADKYNVKLIEPSTAKVVKSFSVSGTNASVTVPYAGVFNISVSASNSQYTGEEAVLRGFWAYSPLNVTFKSWDGKVLSKQTVVFGKDATLPKAPTRTGYTFTGWNGNYKAVKEDTVITAEYTRNKYNVNFYDYDGTLLETQSVYYGDDAVEPNYEAPTGYAFVKWNRNFNNITSETNVKAVISWTSLYPLEISTRSAVQRNNKSYIVTSIVNNSPNAVSDAKVIAVIKTKENKLLATVESENMSLAKGEVKNLTLTASYDGMATQAELFVVKTDNEKIPLASQLSVKVDPGTAWTSWSTSTPPSDALATESRTEYRYRDKKFTTSSSSSLSGWTKYNTTWVWGSYGSTQGPVYSNPGSSDSRKSWSEQYVSGYGTTKHYYYFRYANSAGTSGNDIKTGSYTNYQELDLTYKLTHQSSTKGGSGTYGWKVFYTTSDYNSGTEPYRTYWYKSEADVTDYSKPINGTRWYYQDRSKEYTYHYYQWQNWSDWSTTAYTANDNRQVETRTVYRYVANKADNIENTSGITRTISGKIGDIFTDNFGKYHYYRYVNSSGTAGSNTKSPTYSKYEEIVLDAPLTFSGTSGGYRYYTNDGKFYTYWQCSPCEQSEYSGRYAILSINSKDGAVQYIGQTQLNSNGEYEYTFKLKDEPTIESGDYNVTLSIEGTTAAFALDPILAPVPEYTVKFVDHDGKVISTQTVRKGTDATIPTAPVREGYKFIGWDTPFADVQSDLTVKALYEANMYEVVFIDEINNTSETKTFRYGDTLIIPEVTVDESYDFLGWDAVIDGNTKVTDNMVVTAKFKKKIFTVDFLDFDGSVLESQKVEYGEPAVFPELNSRDNYVFISWNIPGDTTYVTESMTIQPYFEYKDTVATPTASIETGTYNGEQTVTLSCETKGAQIYYTTDGSDPLEEVTNARARSVQRNGTLYTGPFTLDSSSQLLFTAVKDGMNSSNYDYKMLAINTANTEKKQYTVTIHYGVFDAENTVLVNDGEPVELLEEEFYGSGYTLEGVYTDAEYKNVWNHETDTVNGEMDLYLKWSKNNYTVTFKDMNGNVLDTQKVAFGEDATAPMWNEVDGYIFTGWDKSYTSVIEDITVTATYIPETDVTAVEFNKDSLSLFEGQAETISATVKLGTDCTNNALIWQSSDEDVAIVDDNGKVIAVSAGKATIFAVSEDSGMSAQCEVKVEYKDPCLNGNHTYKQETVEPTCTKDGSVITKCSLCGDIKDTEVIPATGHNDADKDGKCDACGEKLADASNCSCNCHKGGFMGFIYKIIRIFWKLFRSNKVCTCGQAHY